YESAHGIKIHILRKIVRQVFVDIIYRSIGVDNKLCFGYLFYDRFFFIILILYLANDFLHNVFQGNHASSTAELINHNRNLYTLLLKLAQQVIDFLSLRNKIWLTDDVT